MKLYNVYLTERDKTILSTVLLFRIMKTSQIIELFFPSLTSGTKRLQDLKNAGYLKANRRKTTGYYTENIWMITRKGLLEASEWLTYNQRPFSSRNLEVDPKMYNHDLRIVQFYVDLVKRGICSIEDLLKGNFLETRSADVPISSYQNNVRLRPDARFKLGECWYWIEIDRGTERLSSIIQKMNRYRAYMDTCQEGKNVVVFLTENGQKLSPEIYKNRIKSIQWNAGIYLGAYSQGGRLEWYTFDISEGVDMLCDYLLTEDQLKQTLKSFIHTMLQNSSIGGYQLKYKDQEYLPSAMMPLAWLGLKGESDDGQFYVVENLVGGASGGLFRLGYFPVQQHEFIRIIEGHRPKLLVLVNHPDELDLIYQYYPSFKTDLHYLTWSELSDRSAEADWRERGGVVNE